jgi:hypothetical protein
LLFDNFHGNLPSHLRLAQAKSQEAKATQPDANALSLIRNSKQPILPHLSQHLRRLGVILQHLHALPVEIGALCREASAAVDARKTTAAFEHINIDPVSYIHTDQCRREAQCLGEFGWNLTYVEKVVMRFTGSRFESSYHQFCTPATPRQVEMQEICGIGGVRDCLMVFFSFLHYGFREGLTQFVAGHQLMDLSFRLRDSAWSNETESVDDLSLVGKALAWRPRATSANAV